MANLEKKPKTIRIALVLLAITLWSVFILVRLVQLQVFNHQSFVQLANQGQQVKRAIMAPRGIIYDSHMDELASSVTVSTAVAEPRCIEDIPAAARNLADILKMNRRELLKRMQDPRRQAFMIVKRRISPQAEKRIESLKLSGVYFVDESMRVYPNRDLACQMLGFVNMNGDGGSGIELYYDKELKGKEGVFSFGIDAHRRSYRVNVETPPVQGHSLVLSIDKSIQYIADRELEAGVKNARARSGIAIVMESETGRILALSNYPKFNCNTYNEYPIAIHRNRAITDMFEPGSTFKVVVATAALEAGLTRPDEMIDCQMGSITIGNHLFHDHKGYGLLSFNEILVFSSNVGAAKLGLRLGEQRLYEALRNFGFGSKTGIDLPGEIVGLVRNWRDWSGLSIGAISFGQEIGVTSIQILTAINAIANGGYRVRPSVVDRIIDEDGDLISIRTPERVRLMSPRTAEAVSRAFEGVVLRGTGRQAALECYRAAGKTGTAQKIVNGRYSPDKFIASFIGYAPLPQPRITVLVKIDEPKGVHYGGEVSAPVFRKIVQDTLMRLRVPPDQTLPLQRSNPQVASESFEDYLPNATPVQPLTTFAEDRPNAEEKRNIHSIRIEDETIVLPDFRGLSKRSVLDLCTDLGIHLQATGTGVAVQQSPLPGATIPSGSTCKVTFMKTDPKNLPDVANSLRSERSVSHSLSVNVRHQQ